MSETPQIVYGGYVRTVKITKDMFAQIQKSGNCLYFVNETGKFDPEYFDETDGDIYLGDKLLTAKPDLAGVMTVDGTNLFLNNLSNGNSITKDFPLPDSLTTAAMLDFFLHATMKNLETSGSGVEVECWMELGYYEDGEDDETFVIQQTVASGMTTIATIRNSTAFANMSISGTVAGPLQESKILRVHFEAKGQISVLFNTTTNYIGQASQVLVRVYKPLNI
jgi:hypothetical protein